MGTNLKPKFTEGQGLSANVEQVIKQLLAMLGIVQTSYSETQGRQSKNLQAIVDAFWRSIRTRRDKQVQAKAEAQGLDGFKKSTPYQAIKSVYQGKDEFPCTKYDMVEHINKLLKAAKITAYLNPDECEQVFNALTAQYVDHPDAAGFITLDDLTDTQVRSLDESKPDGSKKQGASAPASV